MIERYENTIQIAVLLGCIPVALYLAVRHRSRSWTLLSFFYGSWMLGDLYWLLCLLLFGRTPQITVVADLSWFASYLFLYLLLRHLAPPRPGGRKRLPPWLGFVFSFGMAAYFMQFGMILTNLIYASLMGLLLYAAIRRLTDRPRPRHCLFLSVVILVFCAFEYALWTSSCIWVGENLRNPYYWFDVLLTVSFPFFLPAVKKAVTA